VCRRTGPRLLFLRDTEHAIQAWEDRQTQELPVDDAPRLALAHSMGFADWEAFAAALAAHRAAVAQHFAELIAEPEALDADAQAGALLWGPRCDESALAELGFATRRARGRRSMDLFASRRVQSLQAARARAPRPLHAHAAARLR
jgi:glutamate-ammonia-ligase adenylyltransferase